MPGDRTVIAGRYEMAPLPIGQGGMGQVFAGYDQKLDRKVAVKLIRFPYGQYDEELVKRFRHEARIMAKLEHPGAPAIYDADVYDDPSVGARPFLVMQFIAGITVDDLLAENGPLPIAWAADIAAQVVAVLHAAHGRGIFHRDLKPSNLMLCRDGSVKVLDFGLAMFHDPELSRLTRSGTALGSPAYMSPEQIRGAAIGPQSDFYSLGLIAHELLTGRRLFEGTTDFAVFERHVSEPATSIRVDRPDVPEGLDALVLRMLAKRAEDRPSDATDLHAALLRFAGDPPPLPGVISPTPSALSMYAAALTTLSQSQVSPSPASGQEVPSPQASSQQYAQPSSHPHCQTGITPLQAAGPHEQDIAREDLRQARLEAEALARGSRYSQAVDVLRSVLGAAGGVLGARDIEVLEVGTYLAEVLFESGDYRAAAPAFGKLHRDLAARYGPRDDRVLRCRRQEATGLALLGDTGPAIDLLRGLLADEEVIYGPTEPPVLELRRQLGLLELGAGHAEGAARTLSLLLGDLTELYGPEHPETRRVRDSLSRLSFH